MLWRNTGTAPRGAGKRSHPLRRLLASASIALLIGFAQPAVAQPLTTNEAVTRLFEGTVDPTWFSETFLAQVPAQQIALVLASFTTQYGALVAVTGSGGTLTTRLERAELPTQVALDPDGRIVGLFFGNPVPIGGGVEGFVARIAALPGQTSVAVITNGELAAGHEPEAALAVGSAFKLAVLAALSDAAAPGTLVNLDDIVLLDPAWRSLPSGIIQDWRDGTPVTVATLANLMISVSDNTATDALIALVGRDAVEGYTERNRPFPTTGEMFRLKAAGNEGLLEAWRTGDEAARRGILNELATQPLPAVDALSTTLTPDVEWFFNAFELCALLDQTADMWAFDINPGLARRTDWASIAFKGGSEPGVLNLSTRVVDSEGNTHCVVATWNNTAALDEQALFTAYSGLLRSLAVGDEAPVPPAPADAAPAVTAPATNTLSAPAATPAPGATTRETAPARDAAPGARGQLDAGRTTPATAPATRPVAAYTDDGVTVTPAADFTLTTNAADAATQGVIPPCDPGFNACIYYSGTTYAGTNFETAGLSITRRTDLTTAETCLNTQPDGYSGLTVTTHDGGTWSTSYIAGVSDAGMGHYSNGAVFRLAEGSKCWEFQTRIGATQFGNYTPGTIKEFTTADNAAVDAALRSMINGVTLSDGTVVVFPPGD